MIIEIANNITIPTWLFFIGCTLSGMGVAVLLNLIEKLWRLRNQ
jgi:hypothetical protein